MIGHDSKIYLDHCRCLEMWQSTFSAHQCSAAPIAVMHAIHRWHVRIDRSAAVQMTSQEPRRVSRRCSLAEFTCRLPSAKKQVSDSRHPLMDLRTIPGHEQKCGIAGTVHVIWPIDTFEIAKVLSQQYFVSPKFVYVERKWVLQNPNNVHLASKMLYIGSASLSDYSPSTNLHMLHPIIGGNMRFKLESHDVNDDAGLG
jgi:hypothetical protein